jgi:hypothetical protein
VDVLQAGQVVDQEVVLEDEPEVRAAELGEAVLRELAVAPGRAKRTVPDDGAFRPASR